MCEEKEWTERGADPGAVLLPKGKKKFLDRRYIQALIEKLDGGSVG